MSLHRLGARLTRLEHDARRVLWTADFRASCVRLMAEASTAIGLAPSIVLELCMGAANAGAEPAPKPERNGCWRQSAACR